MRSRGFTLIELMIAVAIIGVLASITIPMFLHFDMRAKESEAKANLGSLFMMLRATAVEKNTYAVALTTLGFDPTGHRRYYYSNGVATQTYLAARPDYDTALGSAAFAYASSFLSPTTFKACAAANLDDDAAADVWSIDHDHELLHLKSDRDDTAANF